MSATRIHIHAAVMLGLRFWDWEIIDTRDGVPHLRASGRSNRWAGARCAVERELRR